MFDYMFDFVSGYFTIILLGVVVFLVFGGVIYLILRPLVLWYFKIYTMVSELQSSNALLREILEELKKRNIQTSLSQQVKEDYSRFMPK